MSLPRCWSPRLPQPGFRIATMRSPRARLALMPSVHRRPFSISLAGTAPKGLHDLLKEDLAKHHHILDTARRLCKLYAYEEISTPMMEYTDVFSKSLGDDSDVVLKEMYSFVDASGQPLTLRPEGTAGVVRALLSHKLVRHLPQRLFYHGPMFRYEKPQRGRARQFHQLGVEFFGSAHASAELEVLSLANRFLSQLDFGPGYTLELNSLGDDASRQAYRAQLKDYLLAHLHKLSADSKARIERNSVLRVLDSKEPEDQEVVKHAPRIDSCYTAEARERFEEVQAARIGLRASGIPFTVNGLLMRGLDYYSHTIWEFVSNSPHLVGQRTILAGGRYDSLVSLMRGGRGEQVPAIGWAAGLERLAIVLPQRPATAEQRPVALIVVREKDDSFLRSSVAREAAALTERLRSAGLSVLSFPSGGATKQLQRALASTPAPFAAVFVGSDELRDQRLTLKFLDSATQITCSMAELEARLTQPPSPPPSSSTSTPAASPVSPHTAATLPADAQRVLDFWFRPADSPEHGQPRSEWFQENADFDDQIRRGFSALVEQALRGELDSWDAHPRGALARVILLDQFTRNIFRGTPRAFSGDARALAAAKALIASGGDAALSLAERSFLYMPFMHAEALAEQDRGLQLFDVLATASGGRFSNLKYAQQHRAVIARFGRFPHRNAILGRVSTAEELEYLKGGRQ